MKSFRYDTTGCWFKGNTHLHSTASDGGKTFVELSALYSSAGYDFLFRTDHWVCSDSSQDGAEYPLLWIDGIELDGKDDRGAYFHVVCLGKVEKVERSGGLPAAIDAARDQGAVIIVAHPYWTGNSTDDCLAIRPDGVEIYNHVCHWLNGKSNGRVHWEALLRAYPNTLGLAVDDAHIRPEHPGWNGGWIVVNVADLNAENVIEAIRRGNFYSSCGPDFYTIEFDGEIVHAETSPVQFMRLVGPDSSGKRVGGFDGSLMVEMKAEVPADWPYCYLEIEDQHGRRAWTNTLFIDKTVS